MRALPRVVAAVVAVVAVISTTAKAQEECSSVPRWVLVTVLEQRLWSGRTADEWVFLRGEDAFFEGPTFLRICEIQRVATLRGVRPTKGTIELRRNSPADPHQILVVAESPKQLCAALRECSDATPQGEQK